MSDFRQKADCIDLHDGPAVIGCLEAQAKALADLDVAHVPPGDVKRCVQELERSVVSLLRQWRKAIKEAPGHGSVVLMPAHLGEPLSHALDQMSNAWNQTRAALQSAQPGLDVPPLERLSQAETTRRIRKIQHALVDLRKGSPHLLKRLDKSLTETVKPVQTPGDDAGPIRLQQLAPDLQQWRLAHPDATTEERLARLGAELARTRAAEHEGLALSRAVFGPINLHQEELVELLKPLWTALAELPRGSDERHALEAHVTAAVTGIVDAWAPLFDPGSVDLVLQYRKESLLAPLAQQ